MRVIALGSENPTKIEAMESAANELWTGDFAIECIPVASGVPDQPFSDEEMMEGAYNRARRAAQALPDVDFAVGMEGGIRRMPPYGWFNMGWVCAFDTASGKHAFGATAQHEVPRRVVERMKNQHLELSDAVAAEYKSNTILDRDCPGVITRGVITAHRLYKIGALSAFSALHDKLG